MAWKEEVATYIRAYIFPRKQWVKEEEICWGSVIQRVICKVILGKYVSKWREFWEDQGGQEVVRRTIGRRRQSCAEGQKKSFWSKYTMGRYETLLIEN